jgi:hypothetical protein
VIEQTEVVALRYAQASSLPTRQRHAVVEAGTINGG